MGKHNHYGPYTARPGKSGAPWPLYLLIAAGLLAAALGLCYMIAPETVARIHGRLLGPELAIHSLTLTVDRNPVEIVPGGILEMHPRQTFTVGGLKSNRWHNYDLRLFSPDFDISRASGGRRVTPLELLGGAAIEGAAARLRLQVREGETVRAVFELVPVYTAVDLAAMGDAAVEPARRADLYQKAFDLEPASGTLREKLAGALAEAGRLEPAAKLYEAMIAEASSDEARAAVLKTLRALYREQGRPEQELAVLRRLAAVVSLQAAAPLWSDSIVLYEQLGDLEGQQKAWLELAKTLPDGPNRANAYKRAAYLLAGADKYAEAARAYEAALLLDSADINVYLNLSRLALAQNEREGYRAHLAKALALAPERDDLRRELAGALADDGFNAEAEREYETLLVKNPQDQNSRLRLIAILEKNGGQDARLLEEYAAIVAAQPNNKLAAYNLAVLNVRQEKWNEAIAGLKIVLALDPDDVDARGYLFGAYEKTGDTEAMLNEALEIYRRDTSLSAYRDLLIRSYENAGDWLKLLAVAEEFTRLLPGDMAAWQLLARVNAQLAKPLAAAQSLYRAAEVAGDQVDPWLTAAEAMSDQNQLSQAKAAYEKILAIDPANKRAAEGLLDISLRELSGGSGPAQP